MKPAKEAVTERAAKPKREIRAGLLLSGMAGLAAGLFSVGVEIARNYAYGALKSEVYGYSYALFAVGLALIPLLAWRGWNPWLRATWLTCMLMTAYFGVNYYADGILTRVSEARAITGKYEDGRAEADAAEAERAKAQAEADAIAESRPSAALKRAYADAEVRYEREKKVCLVECKAAKETMRLVSDALPLAEAKERAQARADEARVRRDRARAGAGDGPVEAAPLAVLMAMQAGGNAQDYAAGMDIGEPVALVLGMLLFASLIHPSLQAIKEGLGLQEEVPATIDLVVVKPPAKPALAQRAVSLITSPKREGAKRGRKPMTPEERVLKFLGDRIIIGEGVMTGDEMTNAVNRYWHERWPDERPMRPRDYAAILSKAGVERKRIGGKSRYVASMRPS